MPAPTALTPHPRHQALASASNSAPAGWSALVEWRARTAKAMGVPPYLVVTDAGLREIWDQPPRDRAALVRISGLGPRALAKYGGQILAILPRQREGKTD